MASTPSPRNWPKPACMTIPTVRTCTPALCSSEDFWDWRAKLSSAVTPHERRSSPMRTSTFHPQACAAPTLTIHTVGDLLSRYAQDFLPMKAPATQKQQLSVFKVIDHDLGDISLKDLSPALLRQWRDDLLT